MSERVNEEPRYRSEDVYLISDLTTLKLISDPLRQRILEALRGSPRTVKEIAADLDTPPTKLYYHIRLLEEHGLLRVASTRVVSGIIERHYQTSAARLSIDRELLGGATEGGGVDLAISLVLEEVRADIYRSIAAGLIDVSRYSPGEGGLVLGRTWQRLTRQHAEEFFLRLKELEREIAAAAEHDNPADLREYEILLSIFPRANEMRSAPAEP